MIICKTHVFKDILVTGIINNHLTKMIIFVDITNGKNEIYMLYFLYLVGYRENQERLFVYCTGVTKNAFKAAERRKL